MHTGHDAALSFLGLRPSDEPALIEAATGETTSYRDLLRRAEALRAQSGEDKRLICLLERNDRFSTVVYASTQVHEDAVALLDRSRPVAERATILSSYTPDVVAGPPGRPRRCESLVTRSPRRPALRLRRLRPAA